MPNRFTEWQLAALVATLLLFAAHLAAAAEPIAGAAAAAPPGIAGAATAFPAPIAPRTDPATVILSFAHEVLRATQDAAPRQALGAVLQAYVAEPEIVRFIAALQWRRLNADQQQQAVALFHDCLLAGYADRLAEWAAGLAVTGTRATEDGGALVATRVLSPSAGQPIAIVWRLDRLSDALKITDLLVAGESLAVEKRQEIADAVQRNEGNPLTVLAVFRQNCPAPDRNEAAK
jgi:ABC-type transporter MlaC component